MTLMTFDKQSNGRRTAVESKSNRSCNQHTRLDDEVGYIEYLDLLVQFFDDAAVDQHAVSIVADEAVSVDLDLALFQQQLQLEVGEETMSL